MNGRESNNPMQQSGGLLLDAGLTASTPQFAIPYGLPLDRGRFP